MCINQSSKKTLFEGRLCYWWYWLQLFKSRLYVQLYKVTWLFQIWIDTADTSVEQRCGNVLWRQDCKTKRSLLWKV